MSKNQSAQPMKYQEAAADYKESQISHIPPIIRENEYNEEVPEDEEATEKSEQTPLTDKPSDSKL